MYVGTILFFDPYKGFGRIKDDATGKEFFVHINGLVEQVYKDNKVLFDLKIIDDKEQAVNVVLVKQ